jgi:hypothetical protein
MVIGIRDICVFYRASSTFLSALVSSPIRVICGVLVDLSRASLVYTTTMC